MASVNQKEKELENELFGNLQASRIDSAPPDESESDSDDVSSVAEQGELMVGEVDVDDLFVVDKRRDKEVESIESDDDEMGGEDIQIVQDKGAVWSDSEDDEIEVNLDNDSRLCKLKKEKADILISSKELTRRMQENAKRNRQVVSAKHFGSKKRKIPISSKLDYFLQSSEKVIQTNTTHLSSILSHRKLPSIHTSKNDHLHFSTTGMLCVGRTDRFISLYSNKLDEKSNTYIDYAENLSVSKQLPFSPLQSCFVTDEKILSLHYFGKKFVKFNIEEGRTEVISNISGMQRNTDRLFKKMVVNPDVSYMAIISNQEVVFCRRDVFRVTNILQQKIKDLALINEYKMVTLGLDDRLSLWDMRKSCKAMCFNKSIADHNSIASTCLSMKNGFLAVGQTTGLLNLYSLENDEFSLEKTYPNLRSPVSHVEFSEDAKYLVYAAQEYRGARLIDMDTRKVISNFPGKEQLADFRGEIKALQWASNAGSNPILAVANSQNVEFFRF